MVSFDRPLDLVYFSLKQFFEKYEILAEKCKKPKILYVQIASFFQKTACSGKVYEYFGNFIFIIDSRHSSGLNDMKHVTGTVWARREIRPWKFRQKSPKI